MSKRHVAGECSYDDGQGMIELQMIETGLVDIEGDEHHELGMLKGGQFWPFTFCPSCGRVLPKPEAV